MSAFLSWLRFPSAAVQAARELVALKQAELDRGANLAQLSDRVDALERGRAIWEAEMAGAMVKLESQFKAVRAAEERLRAAKRRSEEDEAAEDDDPEVDPRAAIAAAGGVPYGAYAQPGESNGLPAMSPRMAERAALRARKWGR